MEAIADNSVQCRELVSKEECQQKPKTSFGDILLDVEPPLPVIRKQGLTFLNRPQCEEILKNLLQLLHYSGEFQDHKDMFNFFLQRSVEKDNKGMVVNKQQIPNGDHCNQALKRFQLFQENGRLKKDEQLFSL